MTKRSHKILRWIPTVLIPFLVAALLEIFVRNGWLPDYLFPAPSAIAAAIWDNRTELIQQSLRTLLSSLTGLLISAFAGISGALLLSSSKILERALYPYAAFFQTVPLIAIAPILVIWFGFGWPTVVAASVIASIFPVIANTVSGMWSTPQPLLDLFRLYGASRWRILLQLKLPHAVPQILTGLRIASGLAMIGAIVGEFIAGGGLGGTIDSAKMQQRLDIVFAAVLIASFLGLFLIFLVNIFSSLVLRRFKL